MYDVRWILKLLILLVFLKSFVSFTINKTAYSMPLTLSFFLKGFPVKFVFRLLFFNI
ncbi:DUF817 family protein [Bacillus sp. V2I10]|uniref:DUF817 family protein n=1 Tax=Bacillus sp. V2I10 TaxID=3042276 RepID=UPI0027D88A08|nr:DUF817 family protein [Bacillus sp. V2I10]